MKALVWTAVNQLEIQHVADPAPAEDEVIVRVSHVGICGSDLHIWHGEHPRATPPLIMGHEFSGMVESLGPGVSGVEVGEPVVVYPVIGCGDCRLCNSGREHLCGKLGLIGIDRNGGMAERVAVPARRLHKVPDDMDLKLAALIEPIAIGVHTLGRALRARGRSGPEADLQAGGAVAIVGAGPIGLSVALMARHAGAKRVLVSDISDYRLNVADELGFTAIHAVNQSFKDAVMDATDGEGADYVFEATGIPPAAEGMLDLAAIGGTVVIVGIFPTPIPIHLRAIAFSELTMVGTRHYTPAEFDKAVELIAARAINVEPLISDVYPLKKGAAAFERAAAGTDSVKILIRTRTHD